jgi:hypothetical protein
MTIVDVRLVKLYQLTRFTSISIICFLNKLLPGNGLLQRKRIIIKTIALIPSLAAAGFVISISLPALAENNGANSASPPAEGSADMNEKSSVERAEMHNKWQKLSPEERAARRKEMREHWEKMPPEEREALRKKMKEHWVKMAPEEREAQRKEMREHWEKMSPEERDQFKRDMEKQDEK